MVDRTVSPSERLVAEGFQPLASASGELTTWGVYAREAEPGVWEFAWPDVIPGRWRQRGTREAVAESVGRMVAARGGAAAKEAQRRASAARGTRRAWAGHVSIADRRRHIERKRAKVEGTGEGADVEMVEDPPQEGPPASASGASAP